MTVIGIAGSPRGKGNSTTLLRAALEGAESAGAKTSLVRLYPLKFGGCLGCDDCPDKGCRTNDALSPVLEELRAADAWILASPIYFYGLPAQAKALVDRTQALWARKHRLHRRTRKTRAGYLISAGGSRGKRLFECAELTMKYFCDAVDARYSGSLTFRSLDQMGDVERHPEYLDKARQMGRRISAAMAADLEKDRR